MIEAAKANIGSRVASFFKNKNVQLALLALAWIWTIASIATKDNQWDFKVYYYATIAQAQGENPYDLEVLNKHSPDKIIFPFVYPVVTCYFFRPLTLLPYGVAYQVWLFFKIGLAIYLLWLWRKRFMNWGSLPLMILVATGTFLGAFYRDLNSGNVTLIEQALLWTGFYWLLEERPYRFVAAIAAAAFFKFSLAIFLAAILFTRMKGKLAAIGLGCILVGGYVAIVWMADPEAFANLMQAGSSIKEYTADFNHSSFAVFHDLGKLFAGRAVDSSSGRAIVIGLYLAFVGVVSAFTFRSLRNFKSLNQHDAMFLTICALCLLYVLVVPRMKNYTFIILAVPTYLVLTAAMTRRVAVILTFLLVLPRIKIAAPETAFGFYQYIHPWLMAVIVWWLFVRYAGRGLNNLQIRKE